MQLVNRRTGQTIARDVEMATSRRARRRGLLCRRGLTPSAALLLAPCCSIHTAFMRFSIDAAFIDRDGRVLRIVGALPPWPAAWARRGHAVIGLAACAVRP